MRQPIDLPAELTLSPHEIGASLVSLEELPLQLRLEGFPEKVVRSIAHQWLCRIRSVDFASDAYSIRLSENRRLRFRPRSNRRPPQTIRLRVRTDGAFTELRTPGARTTFVAGQPGAEIEIHPHLLQDPGLLEIATGGALGHALALSASGYLHGAAFLAHDLPILALGRGGSGKSTVAAAALTGAGSVVSDDSLVLYSAASGNLAVRPLRRNLSLREGSLKMLSPALRQRLRRVGPSIDPRWELDRLEADPLFCTTLEPAALCVLKLDRRLKDFQVTALSQAQGLTALLAANGSPHLLHPSFQDEQQRLLRLWGRSTAELPLFELRLGSALLDSPRELIRDIVTRLRELSRGPIESSG